MVQIWALAFSKKLSSCLFKQKLDQLLLVCSTFLHLTISNKNTSDSPSCHASESGFRHVAGVVYLTNAFNEEFGRTGVSAHDIGGAAGVVTLIFREGYTNPQTYVSVPRHLDLIAIAGSDQPTIVVPVNLVIKEQIWKI